MDSVSDSQATIGRPRLHLRLTDSTNERARQLADAGAPHGTLVSAAEQSAGRGRQGRRWSAPPGQALLMSLLLRSPPPLLPLLSALAVSDVAGSQALIKWPNDIVVQEADGLAKLAGILIEARPQAGWAVLGIGINAAVRLEDLPQELRPPAVAGGPLPAATLGLDGEEAIEDLLRRLLERLHQRLRESDEQVLEEWGRRDALRGREVSWAQGSGRAAGIDRLGRLQVLLTDGQTVALGAGEVHLGAPHPPTATG
jgi:BirA family biotin operon repressor/biotin-[acetyl-CoA-carboxylase] ligase